MSLFKEPFDKNIAGQLNARQNLISKDNKTPSDIAYLNSKTAWIKLQSSVNVNNSSDLAKQNVLLGGLLYNNKLKGGVGIDANKAYSLKQSNKETNLLGIRPMPGITNMSIQNKGAFGSLRQASVNFQCWDIKQLEILEQLYMRPGYTVLLEWGWLPYIDSKGKLVQTLYEDNFLTRENEEIQSYLKELYERSLKSEGNYDAMFGYIMNYNWKMRNDGGYDCSLEIISTGEILESYKINYIGSQAITSSNTFLLNTPVNDVYSNLIKNDYAKNILTGLISEVYSVCRGESNAPSQGTISYDANNRKGQITYITQDIDLDLSTNLTELGDDDEANAINPGGDNLKGSVLDNDKNIFITLESLIDLFNNFILLENPELKKNQNLIKLSVKDRPELGKENSYLTCLYHPLQISIDPRVCLINNNKFRDAIKQIKIKNISTVTLENGKEITKITVPPVTPPSKESTQIAKNLSQLKKSGDSGTDNANAIGKELSKIKDEAQLQQVADIIEKENNGQTLSDFLAKDTDNSWFTGNSFYSVSSFIKNVPPDKVNNIITKTSKARLNEAVVKAKQDTSIQAEKLSTEIQKIADSLYLKLCDNLLPFNVNDSYANHANIYINLRLLYNLAFDAALQSQDPSEKQSINLISYIKNVLTYIQNATGNVNNFEIIIDGNTGYICDLNYIPSNINNAFVFNVGTKNSIIRDINVESQIFSDQATIIAISAQSDAGKLGLENSSMVAYNKGVSDRMIFRKDNPIAYKSANNLISSLVKSVYNLGIVISTLNNDKGQIEIDVDKIDENKTALSDLIAIFTGISDSSNKYRSILPTKLSLTMDGIGGIIIGNIFDINKDFIPQSYKGEKTGINLFYTVTNVKHSIDNNIWITTIEGNPFIPDSSFDSLITGDNNFNLNAEIDVALVYDPKTQSVIATQVVLPASNFNNLQFTGNQVDRASTILKSKEGLLQVAKLDTDGKYRGGYGSDIKLVNGKEIPVTATTTFTPKEAEETLKYNITKRFEPVVKNKLGVDTYNKLNPNQQAALISYAYNTGTVDNSIVTNIKNGKFEDAAKSIELGRRTANGELNKGLILRRKEEALLFMKK